MIATTPRLARRALLLSLVGVALQAVHVSAIHGTDRKSRSFTTTTTTTRTTPKLVRVRRGGGKEAVVQQDVDEDNDDDNAQIDAYIDSLVAGVVDDSEHDGNPDALFHESTAIAEADVADHFPNDNDSIPDIHNNDDDDDDDLEEERLRRTAPSSPLEHEQNLPRHEHRPHRPPRPNAVYRFLLDQGRLGRILTMLLIWIAEFVRAFIPPLANAVSVILVAIFGSRKALDEERGINDQYVAFVDSRRTLRGKDKKKAIRMADQEAAEQLRRVGSVTEARYKHLSQDFMQRHGIGPYTRAVENDPSEAGIRDVRERAELDEPVVDEDEDVDWIVAALTDDNPKPVANTRTFPSKPAIDVGVSTTGVTVGVSFSIGGDTSGATKKKKSKSRKKLIEAATSTVSEKRVKAGPRASDRDGGGGVLGRLRDFSANNLVSRSLLGAYPGDALPPTEAASATGLCDFAMKYGYGDWSEEDDEYDVPPVKRKSRKRKSSRSSSSSKRKRKPTSRSSTSSSSSASLSFDFAPPTPKTSSRREKLSPRRDVSQSDLKRRRSDRMVRLPTERLREKDGMLQTDPTSKPETSSTSRRSANLVRPPTELLREKDAALTATEQK